MIFIAINFISLQQVWFFFAGNSSRYDFFAKEVPGCKSFRKVRNSHSQNVCFVNNSKVFKKVAELAIGKIRWSILLLFADAPYVLDESYFGTPHVKKAGRGNFS